jgi:RHS repeat-associated protein
MLNTDGYSYDALHYPAQTLPCANTAAVYAYDVSGSLNSSIRVSSCTPIIFKDFTFLPPPICNYDGPPPLAHKFTGKERDSETWLDYFSARYFGSTMGRFFSPDPSGLFYADPTNPQSLNLYSYVLNNPVKNTDPTGMECVWDDGSYDSADDPDTGSQEQCENSKNGGHWIDPSAFKTLGLPDWSKDPSPRAGGAPFPSDLTHSRGAAPFPKGGCVSRTHAVTISEQTIEPSRA